MFRLENTVWTSAEYLEWLGLGDKNCTLAKLEEILEDSEYSFWNYPLNEMEYCVNEVGGNFAIVEFDDGLHGYEYRICEI